MRDDELSEIEARMMAAVEVHPLPWRWEDDNLLSPDGPYDKYYGGMTKNHVIITDSGVYPPATQALPFFQHCAADVMALIAEVRRLKADTAHRQAAADGRGMGTERDRLAD